MGNETTRRSVCPDNPYGGCGMERENRLMWECDRDESAGVGTGADSLTFRYQFDYSDKSVWFIYNPKKNQFYGIYCCGKA